MRKSPEDAHLRWAVRKLVRDNLTDVHEKVMFLDPEFKVVEVLYPEELDVGGHLAVRDRLLDQAKLRVILHLGLVRDGERDSWVHVVDPHQQGLDPDDPLWTLHQRQDDMWWTTTTPGAKTGWTRRWFPDQ